MCLLKIKLLKCYTNAYHSVVALNFQFLCHIMKVLKPVSSSTLTHQRVCVASTVWGYPRSPDSAQHVGCWRGSTCCCWPCGPGRIWEFDTKPHQGSFWEEKSKFGKHREINSLDNQNHRLIAWNAPLHGNFLCIRITGALLASPAVFWLCRKNGVWKIHSLGNPR